jgi:uncharacterized peroxidase-related enzyme
MTRDTERRARATETPIVGSLPDAPGILVAMRLSPTLEGPLRGLADALLVKDFPGATLTRAERELIATAVSAGNDCFYCMDSHGAFASELLTRDGVAGVTELVDAVKNGGSAGRGAKMDALLHIARVVQRRSRELSRADVERAIANGANDADTQLAVLIASAFCMYNRMVDGLRTQTPPTEDAYRARAKEIADHGYTGPRIVSGPH